MGCRNSGQITIGQRVKAKYGKSCRLEDFWSKSIDITLESVYSQHLLSLESFLASNRSTLVWTQSWFERQALAAHNNRWLYDDESSFDLLLKLSLCPAKLVFCYVCCKQNVQPNATAVSDYFRPNLRLSQNLEDSAVSTIISAVLPSLRNIFDKADIQSISVDEMSELQSVDLPL